MVICKECDSLDVRVNDGNFARTKREGEPSAVHTYNKKFFYCEQCESKWESTPEAEKDYLDYLWLKGRTTMLAHEMPRDGSYGPPAHIDGAELMRREELAKKLVESYRHLLDLAPDEWYEIEQDSI